MVCAITPLLLAIVSYLGDSTDAVACLGSGSSWGRIACGRWGVASCMFETEGVWRIATLEELFCLDFAMDSLEDFCLFYGGE